MGLQIRSNRTRRLNIPRIQLPSHSKRVGWRHLATNGPTHQQLGQQDSSLPRRSWNTLATNPISTGSKYLAGGLYDANNVMWSYNVTSVTYLQNSATSPSYLAYGQLSGSTSHTYTGTVIRNRYLYCSEPQHLQAIGRRYLPGQGTALDKAGLNVGGNCGLGNCNIQFWGYNDTWLGENYGIPAGTYTPKVSALGYIQQTFDKVSLTLSGTPVQISNHLYRGVGFNITAYSIDWEQPRVNRNWVYPGNDIGIGIYNAATNAYISYVGSTNAQSQTPRQ